MKAYGIIVSVLVFVCIDIGAFAQAQQYQFARLDMTYGLSHHMVNDILKDDRGFLWFATSSGLNRYDGYGIKVFRNVPGDTSTILIDDVTRLFKGPDDMLWIYTHSGNCIYNPHTEKFIRKTSKVLKELSIAKGSITQISKDHLGNFWFIHYNQANTLKSFHTLSEKR